MKVIRQMANAVWQPPTTPMMFGVCLGGPIIFATFAYSRWGVPGVPLGLVAYSALVLFIGLFAGPHHGTELIVLDQPSAEEPTEEGEPTKPIEIEVPPGVTRIVMEMKPTDRMRVLRFIESKVAPRAEALHRWRADRKVVGK